MSDKESSYIELARQAALMSTVKRARVGCVVVRRGRVVGIGCNSKGTHTLLRKWGYPSYSGIHAEMAATIGIDRDMIKGARVYVVRVGRGGDMLLAKPCKCCAVYLDSLGVRKTWWSK